MGECRNKYCGTCANLGLINIDKQKGICMVNDKFRNILDKPHKDCWKERRNLEAWIIKILTNQ